MKKILLCIVIGGIFVTGSAFADTISCPASDELSTLFSKSWAHNPRRPQYDAYVTIANTSQLFVGNLRTRIDKLPTDTHPHLTYIRTTLTAIPHYSIWNIDCQYRIHNAEMIDGDDGYLHLPTSVDLERQCKLVRNKHVVCD